MDERFQLVSDYRPQGDQPQAIWKLSEGIERGDRMQTVVLAHINTSGATMPVEVPHGPCAGS